VNLKGKFVYTDSQNIAGLMNRRERLGKNDFQSKKGRGMNHAELYRQFFRMTDLLNCEFRKVEGHKRTTDKNNIDRLFTLVDMASRNAVRNEF
jgi:ribonuclease HI